MRLIIDQECVYNSMNKKCFTILIDNSDELRIQTISFANKNPSDGKLQSISVEALTNCADEICLQFNNINFQNAQIEYAGVSDIPFIFLAAQQLEAKGIQLNDIKLWHNYREPSSSFKGWKLLEDNQPVKNTVVLTEPKIRPALSGNKEINTECVITLASSFLVNYDDLVGLPTGACTTYMYETRSMNRDVISSKNVAIDIADRLKTSIRGLKCSSIHLATSVSVPMAFCLAYTLLQSTYLPKFTIYHYESQLNIKYPWGIEFNRDGYRIIVNS